MEEEEPIASAEPSKGKPIGGLLYLVAIGVILSPISNFINAVELVSLLQNSGWSNVQAQGQVAVIAVLYEFIIQFYMLGYSLLILFWFSNRKKSLPKAFIIYIASIFALGVLGAIIASAVPNIEYQAFVDSIIFPIYVFLLGLIWIPYFVFSKRVKETFTK